MANDRKTHPAVLRTCVVCVLGLFVIATCLPDLRRLWQPTGDAGFVSDFGGNVTETRPDGPANRAGLRPGARLDIAATDPQYRFLAIYGTTLSAGQELRFAVEQEGQVRHIVLITDPEPMDLATKLFIITRELAMLLFVGIGAALVLLRPSPATWGFYFYCLGLHGAPDVVAPLEFGSPWNHVVWSLQGMFINAGFIGVAVFGAFFLHDNPTGWRRYVLPLAGILVLSFAITQACVWPTLNAGRSVATVGNVALGIQAFMALIAMYGLIETYVVARGEDRQRIRWVVLGFGISLSGQVLNALLYRHPPPYWIHATLLLSGVVVPITVAYAIIKHRVIDVSFVVSRALVYGILTTLLVGVFSLIDWFFTDYLRLARLGTVAEVGAVVAFGLWFNGLHRRVDSFIDATFFRQRHQAEMQLARVAAALPLVSTPTAVAHFLVHEPARTLGLASAALFRRERNGEYRREESEGWSATAVTILDASDEPFLALAQAERGPLSIYEHPWQRADIPSGARRPALALPIVVRGELAAVAFYGSHVHGEALDPDEIRMIAQLATGASAAYDHIEADALRRENDALRSALKEAHIQPA